MKEMETIGAIKMLVPTKVETTLTVPQLWNGLFSAFFGTPHDIKEKTGVDIADMYVAKFPDDEEVNFLKGCYDKDGKQVVYDNRGAIWRNMLKIGNDIFPDANMDISVKEGRVCSKEGNTSSEKVEE